MNATAETTAHLERLAAELRGRGWEAKVRMPRGRKQVVHVRNPRDPGMNGDVAVDDAAYRWAWSEQVIGPLTETPGVADRVQHVLREVRS
ncbi:hypothetical protein [Actinomadura rubrisoli]|uniref:Uncharacterized protein n=1 Tax=Actinomadura rubrisoli TaxID=2530368 RepID=A0A4R5AUR5_9ACTN|nr:hypothetical protein [Actinomadura rubrisoli]TDD76165.1 hypothetical protein E1298_31090 [Actinomadura rubrisoli]